MVYSLQNACLHIQVNPTGAELTSVQDKKTGREMLWQADPAVWKGQAPLLFPYCGKLFNNVLRAKGKEYPAPRHGFARSSLFICAKNTPEELEFVLQANPETRRVYPYEFELAVNYRLKHNVVQQTVTVRNPGQPDGSVLPFAVGFHPAFNLPLQQGKSAATYEIAFEVPETPQLIGTPGGYVNGKRQIPFVDKKSIPLREDLFKDDSLCFSGLSSHAVTLQQQQGKGPAIRVGITGFRYVLLWGPPKAPVRFVCIEPWHALPDGPAQYSEFEEKPGLTLLAAGSRYETRLEMQFLV